MNKIKLLIKLTLLLLILPYKISTGSSVGAYLKIKRTMVAVRLL